jgi:hypothetical protein
MHAWLSLVFRTFTAVSWCGLSGVHSSLKERVGVKRGSACGFAGAEVFAGHAEMAPWLPPFSVQVPVFVRAGWLGQGPGGARPPAVAALEASLTRVPASR